MDHLARFQRSCIESGPHTLFHASTPIICDKRTSTLAMFNRNPRGTCIAMPDTPPCQQRTQNARPAVGLSRSLGRRHRQGLSHPLNAMS